MSSDSQAGFEVRCGAAGSSAERQIITLQLVGASLAIGLVRNLHPNQLSVDPAVPHDHEAA